MQYSICSVVFIPPYASFNLTTTTFRDEAGEKRWSDLKARVVEHNIRMMAQYYTKIRFRTIATRATHCSISRPLNFTTTQIDHYTSLL